MNVLMESATAADDGTSVHHSDDAVSAATLPAAGTPAAVAIEADLKLAATQEAKRTHHPSPQAVTGPRGAAAASRRSVGSLGGGCGHGVSLHSCPPWAVRAARTTRCLGGIK